MPLSKSTAAPSRLRRTADDAFRASVLDYFTYTHRVKCMGEQLAAQIDAVLYVDIVGSDEVVALLHEHFHMDSDRTPCSLVATRKAIHAALCTLARLIQANYRGADASQAWAQSVVSEYRAAVCRRDFAGAVRVTEVAALDARYKELVGVGLQGGGVPFAHVLLGSPAASSAA